jgi:myo-inositol-1(or 4)-monophosphatase
VPILGAVLEISTGRCFSGIVGVGAWCDRVQFSCPRPIRDNANQGILGTVFPSGFDHSTENLVALMETTQLFGKTRLLGSAAMSLIYVATGRLDSYFEKRIALWDVGAGIAIVQTVGGVCVTGRLDDEFRLDVEAASCSELLASSVKARVEFD